MFTQAGTSALRKRFGNATARTLWSGKSDRTGSTSLVQLSPLLAGTIGNLSCASSSQVLRQCWRIPRCLWRLFRSARGSASRCRDLRRFRSTGLRGSGSWRSAGVPRRKCGICSRRANFRRRCRGFRNWRCRIRCWDALVRSRSHRVRWTWSGNCGFRPRRLRWSARWRGSEPVRRMKTSLMPLLSVLFDVVVTVVFLTREIPKLR